MRLTDIFSYKGANVLSKDLNSMIVAMKQLMRKRYLSTYYVLKDYSIRILKRNGSPAQVVMTVNSPPSPNPSHKGRGTAISLPLQDYQRNNVEKEKISLDTIWIEITSYCNQKCSFCPDPMRKTKRELMEYDFFKKIVDDIKRDFNVNMINLNAFGEPLLHPRLFDMIDYIRSQNIKTVVTFITNAIKLTEKYLSNFDGHYPDTIGVSVQNDNQESYLKTRDSKAGNFMMIVNNTVNLIKHVISQKYACSITIFHLVVNGNEFYGVPQDILDAFPNTLEQFKEIISLWQNALRIIANKYDIRMNVIDDEQIEKCWLQAKQEGDNYIRIMNWFAADGSFQEVNIFPRPVSTFANFLPYYSTDWFVVPRTFTNCICNFTKKPSLSIYANGQLGICCVDMEKTATFGSINDYHSLRDAITSDSYLSFVANLKKGVLTKEACQICLGNVFNRSVLEKMSMEEVEINVLKSQIDIARKLSDATETNKQSKLKTN
ncbi:radical SAM domain-containing protein [Candidatus Magnetobacterium bavaricum]|uniref:Radical SAM domain-containing protein n=1 Tax=Candidatus Magnetobacterium bavaricum TaxID=29290 RepID=A0A0F3GQX9_9BACT|nr:radical SAM domain-containing protein [Candidatus Magnetobacterium bavaricum]